MSKKPIFELDAQVRTDMGKGASRRLRRLNKAIPAIVYGAHKEPTTITVDHNDASKALENEAFYSHILTLHINGTAEKVVLRDLQRHPYKPIIQHMDFQRISETEQLTMYVPIHFLNEDIAPGVKTDGGIVSHHMTEVEVRCLPKHLPEFLSFDLSNAELDAIFHLSDLALPEGVELVDLTHGHDNNQPIVSIHLPRRPVEEEEEAPSEAAEGEAEEAKGDESEDK